jgi:hypothetical protein
MSQVDEERGPKALGLDRQLDRNVLEEEHPTHYWIQALENDFLR